MNQQNEWSKRIKLRALIEYWKQKSLREKGEKKKNIRDLGIFNL